jgi:hypothetical protein
MAKLFGKICIINTIAMEVSLVPTYPAEAAARGLMALSSLAYFSLT